MGYIHTVNIDNTNSYLIEPILFANLTNNGTTATALSTTIPNFELVAGVSIQVKMTVTNNANATLSVNGGTAKSIYYKNEAITENVLKKDYIYNFVYDGIVWHVVGEKLASSEIVLPHKLIFGAGGVYEFDGSADVTVPVYTGITV